MDDTRADWQHTFRTLLHGWWLIVLMAALGGAAAAWMLSTSPDEDRVTGRLIVAPAADLDANYSLSDTLRLLTQPGILGTITEVVESPGTVGPAADAAGLDDDTLADYTVTAEEVPGSTVLEVHVDGPSAETARALAGGVATRAIEIFDELYPLYDVQTLEAARVVDSPAPSEAQMIGAGAAAGTGLGILLLLGWARLKAPTDGGPRTRDYEPPAAAYPDGTPTASPSRDSTSNAGVHL